MGHAFVVLNPVAGSSSAEMESHLQRRFAASSWTCEVYLTTGEERIADVVRGTLDRTDARVDLFVAAGGDGTVSGVAGGVARTETPMGIVPLGTGNTFARELGIPLGLEPAIDLLTGDHPVRDVDAMAVGERFYVLNVSVGISGLMMRDTAREDRRRFGRIAYVWTGVKKLFGYQPHRFALTLDGERRLVRASEIAIVNTGALGDPSLRWNPQVELDDGRLDVCVLRARSVLDYLSLAVAVALRRHEEEPALHHYVVERRAVVDAGTDLPVQADGEFIGKPPVEVVVVPRAVRIVVPRDDGSGLRRLIR